MAFCQIYQLYDVIGFAVDRQYRRMNSFHDLPLWDLEALDQQIDKDNVSIYVAMFWNHLNGDRREMYERLKFEGYSFANIISPRSSVRGTVGDNCWVMDNVVVQEGAKVGNNVIIADNALVGNLSQVGHHCFIGVHSTIMGGVIIGNQTFVGVCTTIFENLTIGEKSIIGATSIIKDDILAYTVVKAAQPTQTIKHYTESDMESKLIANYHTIRKSPLSNRQIKIV